MGRKRENAVQIYLSDAEFSLLKEQAKECRFHNNSKLFARTLGEDCAENTQQ